MCGRSLAAAQRYRRCHARAYGFWRLIPLPLHGQRDPITTHLCPIAVNNSACPQRLGFTLMRVWALLLLQSIISERNGACQPRAPDKGEGYLLLLLHRFQSERCVGARLGRPAEGEPHEQREETCARVTVTALHCIAAWMAGGNQLGRERNALRGSEREGARGMARWDGGGQGNDLRG
jgi:hypothetical protein